MSVGTVHCGAKRRRLLEGRCEPNAVYFERIGASPLPKLDFGVHRSGRGYESH